MIREWKANAVRRMQDAGITVVETARILQISDKSVRKYRDMTELPGEQKSSARDYRTREDPLAPWWPEIEERLQAESRLKPFIILAWLGEKYPDQITPSIRRTLERRISSWKRDQEHQKEVMFSQIHDPGDVIAFDFVDLRDLGITIRSRPYAHLMFHAVLTFSNWEHVHVCQSESFEAVAQGLQDALQSAGGVPRRVRSDSLTAAVNNLSADREFQPQYQRLLSHYGLTGHRINVRKPHENGDVESSHGHLKTLLTQSLMLRGSWNFESVDEYRRWSQGLVAKKNQTRRLAVQKDQACLRSLPPERLDCYTRTDLKVSSDSIIHVRQNAYSVNSKYIGLKLQVRIQQDEVELWYAGQRVDCMPRLFGKGKECIDYRHVIDSLIRKPGAFRNYKYVQHMFPTIWFRMAWDQLCGQLSERVAVKQYLAILYDAKYEGQDRVDGALRKLLGENQEISVERVRAIITSNAAVALPTDVNVELPNLSDYETLCHKDVHDEETAPPIPDVKVREDLAVTDEPTVCSEPSVSDFADRDELIAGDRHGQAGGAVEGTAAAHDSGTTPAGGRPCCSGTVDPHPLSGGPDRSGMPDAHSESSGTTAAELASAGWQDVGSVSMVTPPAADRAAVRNSPSRELSGSTGQCSDFWQARFREDESVVCTGRRTRTTGTVGLLHNMPVAGGAPVEGKARSETGAMYQIPGEVRSPDHRRSGLCAAESRRDGGALYAAGREIRTRQCAAEQQSSLQQVGTDFQRPHDHCSSHRSTDPSFRSDRTQHPQLSTRCCQTEAKTQSRFLQLKNPIRHVILQPTQQEFLIVANAKN